MTLKVLLNVESLTPPISGIGNYTQHLVEGLQQHPAVDELRFFTRSGWQALPQATVGRRLLPGSLRRWLRRIPYAYDIRNALTGSLFKRASATLADEFIYHETNYILAPYSGPSVVTVSDLSHIHYPQHHPRERVQYLERNLGRTVERADRIITASEFIRSEVLESLGVNPAKVISIPLGVDEDFHPRDEEAVRTVTSKHGLADVPYLLTVGTVEPRKNLSGLINAFATLPEAVRRRHPLVIAGARGWLTEPIEQAMAPLRREGTLHWLGYVSREELPVLYAGAHAFAYFSLYEGFGLPPLEAMASGVPTAVSDRAALPEVAQDAALYADPHDMEGMGATLQQVLEDEAQRSACRAEGVERAALYRWDACIARTVGVYNDVLAARSPSSVTAPPHLAQGAAVTPRR